MQIRPFIWFSKSSVLLLRYLQSKINAKPRIITGTTQEETGTNVTAQDSKSSITGNNVNATPEVVATTIIHPGDEAIPTGHKIITGDEAATENIIDGTEPLITGHNINIINEPVITTNAMNTDETTSGRNSSNTPAEFRYLESLINYRLNNPAGEVMPAMPEVETWDLPVKKFIQEHTLDKDEAILLLIGLAPHAVPELFDTAIQEKLKTSGDFPEIGGVRGKNFRGFLPTGQTAVYLLAGDSLLRRKQIEQLFWSDKDLAKKKILWLEELPQGEPVMSGKITMALDYIDLFLFGSSAPPHFSTSFPARKITTKLTSKDIVMNNEVRRHYENLKDSNKHNPILLKDWDKKERFKKGFRILFYGPPGTGKTLTANVLGNEIKKDVYKIDLSMVVSKYIGETEKNLELLFARAEDKNWVLFFDEADAIFGKRTGVRDAHDKYANQEVSYLLQRIEDFDGLVILATNMKNNIDDAFIRRFDDIVKFTLPNESERKEIWEKSFPENADFQDIPNKVKKYELSGGNISKIIHYAGIQAIKKRNESIVSKVSVNTCDELEDEEETKLKFYFEDVIEGIRREMIKEGKPFV
jgi:AAA+ superfamily predicted ATPase